MQMSEVKSTRALGALNRPFMQPRAPDTNPEVTQVQHVFGQRQKEAAIITDKQSYMKYIHSLVKLENANEVVRIIYGIIRGDPLPSEKIVGLEKFRLFVTGKAKFQCKFCYHKNVN